MIRVVIIVGSVLIHAIRPTAADTMISYVLLEP